MRFWKEVYEDGEQIVFRCEKDMKTRGQEGAAVEHVERAWMIRGALPWPRRWEVGGKEGEVEEWDLVEEFFDQIRDPCEEED